MRKRRRCGFHGPSCAWRIAIGTLTVCCSHAASVGAVTLTAQAPSTGEEVGMAHWGASYVWLRVNDAGLVQVYASTGYRSAFVQPVTVSASEVDRWATALDQLAELTNARPASMMGEGTPRQSDETNSRVVLGGGDLVLEMEGASTSEPKLRVSVGATRPDAVFALVIPEVAGDAALMLREAARRARVVASAAAVASVAAAVPTTTPIEPAATPTASVAVAASAPPTESRDAPVSVAAPATSASMSSVAAASQASLPLASASHAATLVSTRTTTTVAGLTAPTMYAATGHGSRDAALPVLRTTTTTKPMHLAASALATVTTVNTAPQRENARSKVKPTSAPRSTRSAASAPAEDAHGVDDATVQNLVGQWRPDLMYCYTQYGLREHTALTGALVVRLALSPNGSVGHSVIGSRRWSGEGGPDVESCIRSRIAAWRFPPARVGSIHTFNLAFAPGRS